MQYEYDYLVFIGRFQPFHYGHAEVIKTALQKSRNVIVLVGSARSPRSWRNPFTYEERANLITNWYDDELKAMDDRLIVLPLGDHAYNDVAWIQEVQEWVREVVSGDVHDGDDPNIGLIGHSKDASSYYLGLFPQWGSVNVGAFTDRKLFNSTEVRHAYFDENPSDEYVDELWDGMPMSTCKFLLNFKDTDEYHTLCGEHEYVKQYKIDHSYANPKIRYRATHTTVDAVVVQSGHVLLIERKAFPGKGLWAIPGGFVNQDETLEDATLRELREETKVKVPVPVLRGNISDRHVFDDPHRSARGRIFSHTSLITLPADPRGLPRVRGADDAAKAWWQPLSELPEEKFFEDHYHIIMKMTGGL